MVRLFNDGFTNNSIDYCGLLLDNITHCIFELYSVRRLSMSRFKDITGQKFGRLTALYKLNLTIEKALGCVL